MMEAIPGHSTDAVAAALVDFMPQFNDKLMSLTPSSHEAAGSLTKSRVRALMLLRARTGATATELGECMGMTTANLTAILDGLESRGLAQRSADPEDRRKMRIALTARGRKAADAIVREFNHLLAERIAPLSDEDRGDLARSLASAASILEKL